MPPYQMHSAYHWYTILFIEKKGRAENALFLSLQYVRLFYIIYSESIESGAKV